MDELELAVMNGYENKLYNQNGELIAKVRNKHYSEGLVKLHYNFMAGISVLEEIYFQTDNEVIKKKIINHLNVCVR